MQNMLLEEVEYKIEETSRGVWRRFAYPTGGLFAEFRSHRQLWGMPVLHYTRGICPETGRRVVARGVIGIGRLATGVIAIGHASFGVIAIGQLAVGVVFGLGQAATGAVALGQLAIALLFGAGQIATGSVAIGQIALGKYVLAQIGLGPHVWSPDRTDPEAVAYFKALAAPLLGR
jgi:hypothetical protein